MNTALYQCFWHCLWLDWNVVHIKHWPRAKHHVNSKTCRLQQTNENFDLETLSSHIQWNLSWETTAMRDHLFWKTRCSWPKDTTFYRNWTCHERPPVLRDHIFMGNRVVFQDKFYRMGYLWPCSAKGHLGIIEYTFSRQTMQTATQKTLLTEWNILRFGTPYVCVCGGGELLVTHNGVLLTLCSVQGHFRIFEFTYRGYYDGLYN